MKIRLITGDQWKYYDIVLKLDDDADKIIVGMLTLGKCKTWFDDDQVLELEAHANPAIPPKTIVLKPFDKVRLVLSGDVSLGKIEVTLRPNDNLYRVKDRGFRWINEVPFDR